MLSIAIVFIGLSLLIIIHELGHFWAAKYFNILVEEFGFGFPPRLIKKKIGETLYSFNLLPLGGYVKLHGELQRPENGHTTPDPRSFINQRAGRRAIVVVAGCLMNFLAGWLIISLIFWIRFPSQGLLIGFINGWLTSFSIVAAIVVGLSQIFVAPQNIVGPVGIVNVAAGMGELGLVYVLQLLGLISLNLAVLNMLPIPALDGGRLLFIIIEKIRGRAFSPKAEIAANSWGLALLVTLLLVVTFRDIANLL